MEWLNKYHVRLHCSPYPHPKINLSHDCPNHFSHIMPLGSLIESENRKGRGFRKETNLVFAKLNACCLWIMQVERLTMEVNILISSPSARLWVLPFLLGPHNIFKNFLLKKDSWFYIPSQKTYNSFCFFCINDRWEAEMLLQFETVVESSVKSDNERNCHLTAQLRKFPGLVCYL